MDSHEGGAAFSALPRAGGGVILAGGGEVEGFFMNERTRLGLGVIEASLLLGVIGDALLRATPWGLNVTLWVCAFLAAALALARRDGAKARAAWGEGRWLWPAIALLAVFFSWRDSLTLRALDTWMILGGLALAALATRGGRVRLASLSEYALSAVTSVANAVFGFLPLAVKDVKWGEVSRAGWSRHVWAVVRGALLAAPLVLLFGALFVAADAAYEKLVKQTFGFDAEEGFTHFLIIFFVTWITGGYLRGALLARDPVTTFGIFRTQSTIKLNLHDTRRPATPPPAGTKPPEGAARAQDASEKKDPSELRGLFSGADPRASATSTPPTSTSTSASTSTTTPASVSAPSSTPPPSATSSSTSAPSSSTSAASSSTPSSQPSSSLSPSSSEQTPGQLVSLGLVEVGVVVGVLDALFLSFVVVQLRYFFGDAAHVINSAGLTFSDYARRGFFELVWVAALALALLLAAHWLLRKDASGRAERVFRVLAGAMLALLFVIMASALWRMRLYQLAYGQTELRYFTTAFMLWLGAVLVWFAATVLRGRRERFAWGAAVAGFVTVVALHAVNPSEQIVRSNLARAQTVGRFDSAYNVSLGDDAVPALVSSIHTLHPRDRNYVAHRLVTDARAHDAHDWRSWNLGRWRARRAVREHEATLTEWAREWEEEALNRRQK